MSKDDDHYPFLPGFKTGGTSRVAAEDAAKKAPWWHAQVLRELRRRPMTADECAMELNTSILTMRPRFSELYKQGRIRDTGARRRNHSGKFANVWEVTPDA